MIKDPQVWGGIAFGALLLIVFSGLSISTIFNVYVAYRESLLTRIKKRLAQYSYLERASVIWIVSLAIMIVILTFTGVFSGSFGTRGWNAAVISTVFIFVLAFFGIRYWYRNIDKHGKAKEQRKNPYRRMFFQGVNTLSIILLAVGLTGAFLMLFADDQNGQAYNAYNAMGLSVVIIWAVIFLRYFVWAIYHYNINFGLTDKDWDAIFQAREDKKNGMEVSEDRLKAPKFNPYRSQTFGLPPGTVRGMIAITLLFGAITMLIVSMGLNGKIDQDSFFWDHFEFYKTAFLMMIAFYFGDRSLKYLQKRWPSVQQGKLKDAQLKKNNDQPNDEVAEDDEEFASDNDLLEPALDSPSQVTDLKNILVASESDEMADSAGTKDDLEEEFVQIRDKKFSKKLTNDIIEAVAKKFSIELAVLKAVIQVESSGSGFLSNGKPKIIFEGHKFWYYLNERGFDPAALAKEGNQHIIYKSQTDQFYRGGIKEYARFERAYKIDPVAAIYSTSWGLFQILGENFHPGWGVCHERLEKLSDLKKLELEIKGLSDLDKIEEKRIELNTSYGAVLDKGKLVLDPEDFMEKQAFSEWNHLLDFIAFLKNKKTRHPDEKGKTLYELLKSQPGVQKEYHWRAFAYGYNGAGYEPNNYHGKLERAYNSFKKG